MWRTTECSPVCQALAYLWALRSGQKSPLGRQLAAVHAATPARLRNNESALAHFLGVHGAGARGLTPPREVQKQYLKHPWGAGPAGEFLKCAAKYNPSSSRMCSLLSVTGPFPSE